MKLDCCPFCPKGEGTIDLDTDAAQLWEPPSGRSVEVSINHNPDQPIVRFLPRSWPGGPCSHLIFLHVNLDSGAAPRCWHPITLSWTHSFLIDDTLPFARFQTLWHWIVEPIHQSEPPSVRFRVNDPHKSWRRTRGGKTIQAVHGCGTTIYVDDVGTLFHELQRRMSV